ncbi:MAG: TldD/PmbA family protein [Deltaproteobacteria bacterium]|nr:TldD/PmbA family protein [Deltaproteobacteria bacterium]
MTGVSRDTLLSLLEGAVRAARALGATDAEASHAGQLLGITRFANSTITQSGVVVERRTRLRVALGDRVGTAMTSALDEAGLADAARSAVELARHQPPTPKFPGFSRPSPDRPPHESGFFEATSGLGPKERAEAVARVFVRAERDNLLCAGTFVTSPKQLAVVTARGVAAYHQFTQAGLELIALDGDASGYASFHGPDVTQMDLSSLAERAVDTACRSRKKITMAPQRLDVVLAPPAVVSLLEWMAMTSFSARAVLDGTSFLVGAGDASDEARGGEARTGGTQLWDPSITLIDDWGYDHPSVVPFPFDAEGTPRRRVVLVDRGLRGRPVTDRQSAALLDDEGGSTGHAAFLGEELAEGPFPANIVCLPGDASTADLISRVERGLFVTRFHYVNGFLDTKRAAMTGMTRDGTFLIEDGRLGAAVTNLRFTERIVEAFSRAGGVGKDLVACPTSWSTWGNYLAPALLLREFHFTGQSR